MKLRCDRSRKTRSASRPARARGRLRLELARLERAVEVGGVEADEGPVDRAVEARRAAELAQLLALGGRRRGEADPAAAHEDEGGRAERLGGREERALLHPQLEVLEAERHVPRAPGLRPERQVDEAVDLARLLPAHDRPGPPAPLHREPPVEDLRPRLGRGEHLDVGVEPGRPFRRGRPPEEAQHGLVRGEGELEGLLLDGPLLRRREVPQREPRREVPGLPGRLDPPEEARPRPRRAPRAGRFRPGSSVKKSSPARAARAGRRGRRMRILMVGGRGRLQVDHRPPSRTTAGLYNGGLRPSAPERFTR